MLPDYPLKVVGDDTTDEALRLKFYIEKKRIKNSELLGFKEEEELEKIIQNARFIVIPSIWYDNLPNTALESFQQSKPVITSIIGSLSELVKDGLNDYLFEMGNVKKLAKNIRLLDSDKIVQEMRANRRHRFEENYMAQKHYEALVKVFKMVLRQHAKEKPVQSNLGGKAHG